MQSPQRYSMRKYLWFFPHYLSLQAIPSAFGCCFSISLSFAPIGICAGVVRFACFQFNFSLLFSSKSVASSVICFVSGTDACCNVYRCVSLWPTRREKNMARPRACVRSASNGFHVLCLRFDIYFFLKPNGMCKSNLFFHLTWRPLDFPNAPRYTQTTNAIKKIKKANEMKRRKTHTVDFYEVKADSRCHDGWWVTIIIRKRWLTAEACRGIPASLLASIRPMFTRTRLPCTWRCVLVGEKQS